MAAQRLRLQRAWSRMVADQRSVCGSSSHGAGRAADQRSTAAAGERRRSDAATAPRHRAATLQPTLFSPPPPNRAAGRTAARRWARSLQGRWPGAWRGHGTSVEPNPRSIGHRPVTSSVLAGRGGAHRCCCDRACSAGALQERASCMAGESLTGSDDEGNKPLARWLQRVGPPCRRRHSPLLASLCTLCSSAVVFPVLSIASPTSRIVISGPASPPPATLTTLPQNASPHASHRHPVVLRIGQTARPACQQRWRRRWRRCCSSLLPPLLKRPSPAPVETVT